MASSISDWLFGSGTNPKVNSTSVVSQGQPEWWLETVKNLIGKSSAIAAEPYQAYTGQRIAGPTADTNSAYDLTRSSIGNWQPSFNTATNTLSNISTGNADNVMDMLARRGQRNLNENLLPSINKTYIGAGQFGSGKQDEFMKRAVRDTNESILDAQAGAYLQNQAQQAGAAQGLGALSAQGQSQNIKDAAALQGIGAEQQAQTQKSLDTAYNQFVEERNAPRDTAQFMSQIIRGYNPPTTTTTSTDSVAGAGQLAASPLSQLAGAGIGAYGLSKAFARGGEVDMRGGGAVPRGIGKYADGGAVKAQSSKPDKDAEDARAKAASERARIMRGIGRMPKAPENDDDTDAKIRRSDKMNGSEETPGYAKGGWIKGAIKKPGALHEQMGIPKGEKIPAAKLAAAAKAPGKLGQRARLAETMRGFKHAKGGAVGIGRAA